MNMKTKRIVAGVVAAVACLVAMSDNNGLLMQLGAGVVFIMSALWLTATREEA